MASFQLLTASLLLLGVTLTALADPNEQLAMQRTFQISCKNCNTLQYGDPSSGAALTEHACPAGTLCGPVSGAYSCIAEDSADVASCHCGDQENTYIAEPYDPSKYIACLPGGEQAVLTCDDGIFSGEKDKPCVPGPSCESAKKGFNALLPHCTKYFFCETGGSDISDGGRPGSARSSLLRDASVPTFECPSGQVFDVTQLTCVNPCSLAPAMFACEPAASGTFPDPEDCSIFHVCVGGAEIGNPVSCPVEQVYDPEESKCQEDKSKCNPILNECYTAYQAGCVRD